MPTTRIDRVPDAEFSPDPARKPDPLPDPSEPPSRFREYLASRYDS